MRRPRGRTVRATRPSSVWQPSALARRLATAALLALLAAVLVGHAALVLLAAPVLGALALVRTRRPPGQVMLEVSRSASRCFEGEDVTVTAVVRAQDATGVTLWFEPSPQVTVTEGAAARTVAGGEVTARWVVRCGRWGRSSPGEVCVVARARGWQAPVSAKAEPLEIFPRPSPTRPRLVPAELLRRIGEHTGRAVGSGVEFAGLRPYVPGDPLRDINRAVSIRRRQLHVNQRAAARAADLVVMIDAFGEDGALAARNQDLAVHGAAALVTAYLRVSDRAGVVVLGGLLRWLGPAPGDRQFFRIAEMMLRARYDSYVSPDVGRIPRTALPPGTLVVAFSPLLDARAFGALTDLRQRGFPLIVIDTLRGEPPRDQRPSGITDLAVRLWRLDRAATRAALANLGVPVLRWPADAELDTVLAPLRRPPPAAVRR